MLCIRAGERRLRCKSKEPGKQRLRSLVQAQKGRPNAALPPIEAVSLPSLVAAVLPARKREDLPYEAFTVAAILMV